MKRTYCIFSALILESNYMGRKFETSAQSNSNVRIVPSLPQKFANYLRNRYICKKLEYYGRDTDLSNRRAGLQVAA